MEKIKIAIGLAIIVASFVYILRNKSSMLDNLMKKSVEDYEKQKKIQDKAKDVVDGKADAFDTIADTVKPVIEDIKQRQKPQQRGHVGIKIRKRKALSIRRGLLSCVRIF